MKISKFEHAVNVGYGLAILFALVGMIAKPAAPLPLAILLMTVVLWTACRIVRNGAMSLIALLGKGKDE